MTQREAAPRQLRTVLFTDIVGSTDMAAQLGDRRWRALVARHHQTIRRELKRHRGREVDTAGDGFFATFENPTDGLACASAAVAAVHGLGLRIRAGLHTGEVELAGDKASGIAVHIGARLLAMAEPEQVLVTGTLRELVAGSGQQFEDRGVHGLKGVPGEWHVYALLLPTLDEAVVAAAEESEGSAGVARRRRWALGAVLLAALLGAVAIVAFLAWPRPTPAPIDLGADNIVAYAAADGQPVAGAPTGRGPGALALGEGSVWVSNTDSGTVTRVDTDDSGASTVGQVGSHPSDIASDGGLVWVADRYSNLLAILDAGSGELQAQATVHAGAIDAGHGALWATDDLHDLLRRLDRRTGRELGVVELEAGTGPYDVEADDDAVWVAGLRSGGVLRLDPATLELSAKVEVPGVERLSSSGDDLWAVSPAFDSATRIDAASARIAVSAEVCDTPVAVAAVPEGGAWIACSAARALWHVDDSGKVEHRVELEAVPTDVALDGGRVWVSLRED